MSIIKHLLALIVLVILLGVAYAFSKRSLTIPTTPINDDDAIACTMDAMMCPDGTYVGRSGPQCQFVCPVADSIQIYDTSIGQQIGGASLTIVPMEILEDSRCPTGVQCVWAGQVRLKIRVNHNATTTDQILTLGVPMTIASSTVTLTSVLPVKQVNKTIVASDYRFRFEIRN